MGDAGQCLYGEHLHLGVSSRRAAVEGSVRLGLKGEGWRLFGILASYVAVHDPTMHNDILHISLSGCLLGSLPLAAHIQPSGSWLMYCFQNWGADWHDHIHPYKSHPTPSQETTSFLPHYIPHTEGTPTTVARRPHRAIAIILCFHLSRDGGASMSHQSENVSSHSLRIMFSFSMLPYGRPPFPEGHENQPTNKPKAPRPGFASDAG